MLVGVRLVLHDSERLVAAGAAHAACLRLDHGGGRHLERARRRSTRFEVEQFRSIPDEAFVGDALAAQHGTGTGGAFRSRHAAGYPCDGAGGSGTQRP